MVEGSYSIADALANKQVELLHVMTVPEDPVSNWLIHLMWTIYAICEDHSKGVLDSAGAGPESGTFQQQVFEDAFEMKSL